MIGLIDGDILSYEIPFAAMKGWQKEGEPPFDYVAEMLHQRVENIKHMAELDEIEMYMTGKGNFRFELATTQSYKSRDHDKRPFHYDNIRYYMISEYNAVVVDGMEADDMLSIRQMERLMYGDTTICTRDKDLHMVAGRHYGWELGKQPQFGPVVVSVLGDIALVDKKLKGTGLFQFYGQLLTGDVTDSIPGLPKYGPVKAFSILNGCTSEFQLFTKVKDEYQKVYPADWEARMLEQGRLLWMVQSLDEEKKPIMWEFPNVW